MNSKHITRLPDEIEAVKIKSKGVAQDLAKARELVLTVGRAFRKIETECIINQLDERTIAQYGKFANRVYRVLGENPRAVSPDEDEAIQTGKSDATPFGLLTPKSTFPATEKLIADVQSALDETPPRYAQPGMATDADIRINMLEQEIASIRAILGEAQSKEKVIKEIRALIERQNRVRREILELQIGLNKELLSKEPAIGAVGQLFLSKGEVKKVKHALRWRQYDKDDLAVKVTSSDPKAIVVPAELKLNFEKNQSDFEYEIRAGNMDGEFTVTLTPEVGDKVEVKVVVK